MKYQFHSKKAAPLGLHAHISPRLIVHQETVYLSTEAAFALAFSFQRDELLGQMRAIAGIGRVCETQLLPLEELPAKNAMAMWLLAPLTPIVVHYPG